MIGEVEIYKSTGGLWACYSASFGDIAYAAAVWTSPVARMLDDGRTLELRRYAIAPDAPKNTGSRLLRVMRLLIKRELPAVKRLVSYQDESVHDGTIYAAAGWSKAGFRRGGEWSCKSRSRNPTQASGNKIRWEVFLSDSRRFDAGSVGN